MIKKNGLNIIDGEELNTHGGSLRLYAQRQDSDTYKVSKRVKVQMEKEIKDGINTNTFYKNF